MFWKGSEKGMVDCGLRTQQATLFGIGAFASESEQLAIGMLG